MLSAHTARPQVAPEASTHQRQRIRRYEGPVESPVHNGGEHGLEIWAHRYTEFDQLATLARTIPRHRVPTEGQGTVRPVLEHLFAGPVESAWEENGGSGRVVRAVGPKDVTVERHRIEGDRDGFSRTGQE